MSRSRRANSCLEYPLWPRPLLSDEPVSRRPRLRERMRRSRRKSVRPSAKSVACLPMLPWLCERRGRLIADAASPPTAAAPILAR